MTNEHPTYTEEEYVANLEHERHMYAWCLITYAGVTPQEAHKLALSFYEYKAPDDPYRCLMFHDEAWHWAMLKIAGEGYWQPKPELEIPAQEYRAASLTYETEHGI